MGGGTSNASKITQSVTNNLLQNNRQACDNRSSNSADGNVVIFSNVSGGGDLTGVQQVVNTDFTCSITNNMEQTIASLLQSITKQTAHSQNDLLGGIQVAKNKVDIAQSILNNMTQINESLCSSNTITSSSNNFVYFVNSKAGGNVVGASQKANPKSQCTINTITKMLSHNEIKATTEQTATVLGLIPGIFAGLSGIIVMVIVGVVIISIIGAIGYLLYAVISRTGKSKGNGPTKENIGDQISSGELGPDELAKLEAGYQDLTNPQSDSSESSSSILSSIRKMASESLQV